MSITLHKSGCWLFQFDKIIDGSRERANKVLPKGWSKKQAQEYDRVETARIYAIATGVSRSEPLIEAAVLLYLQQHAPSLKNYTDLTHALALCQSAYAGKKMNQLAEVARDYAADQQGRLSSSTVRNRMAYLRAACRWAWKHHKMGEHDPAERMVLPPASPGRQVYFNRADMLRVARRMHYQPSRATFRVAFYTGLRLSEVLRSAPVQTVSGLGLGILDSKNGTPHIVPVNPRIAHLARSKQWPPRVHKSTVSHHTKVAMMAADLGHARFHDSRHSTASEMINQGVSLNTVAGVLNHKTTTSTRRYAHLATQQLADAVMQVGKKSVKKPQPILSKIIP